MATAPAIPKAIATGNTEFHPPVSAIAPNMTPETTDEAVNKHTVDEPRKYVDDAVQSKEDTNIIY